MTFPESLRQLITQVFGPLRPEHGIADAQISEAQARLGLKLPSTLRDFYSICGNHKPMMDGMNHFNAPVKLSIVEGGLVFVVEPQGVTISGILLQDLRLDDPPVKQRNPRGGPWNDEGQKLSQYLLVCGCWQATNVLPSGATAKYTVEQLETLKSTCNWARFGPSSPDDTVGLWRKNRAMVAFEQHGELYVVATTDNGLKRFGRENGLDLSFF